METVQHRRCLVFADKKSSTRRVAESLRARGLRRVRTLPLEDAPDGAPEDGGAAEAAGEARTRVLQPARRSTCLGSRTCEDREAVRPVAAGRKPTALLRG